MESSPNAQVGLPTLESKKEILESLNKKFEYFFLRDGYSKKDAVGIVSKDDSTLIFINSTMAPLKKEIASDAIPEEGIFLTQPCLRSNDQNSLFKENEDIIWPSYFYMLGAVVKSEHGSKLFESVVNFLTSTGINTKDLVIRTSKDLKVFKDVLSKYPSHNIDYDSEDASYYLWKYGMESITGEGITFSFKDKNGQLQDLGNLIAFIREGKLIAWEAALGSETILSKTKDKNVFESAIICDIVEYRDSKDFRKFLDAVSCMVEIIQAGVGPGAKKEEFILRKYIKAVTFLSPKFEDIDLLKTIKRYCLARKYDVDKIVSIYEKEIGRQILEKEKNVVRFKAYYIKNKVKDMDWTKLAYESYSLNTEDVEKIIYDNR